MTTPSAQLFLQNARINRLIELQKKPKSELVALWRKTVGKSAIFTSTPPEKWSKDELAVEIDDWQVEQAADQRPRRRMAVPTEGHEAYNPDGGPSDPYAPE